MANVEEFMNKSPKKSSRRRRVWMSDDELSQKEGNAKEPKKIMEDVIQTSTGKPSDSDQEISKLKEQIQELEQRNIKLTEALKKKDHIILNLRRNSEKDRKPNPATLNDEILVLKNKSLQSVGTIKTFKALKEELSLTEEGVGKVTRKTLELKYNVNPSQIKESIDALEKFGFIEVIQESERRRKFKIIKDLPSTYLL
jgi:DNA-binding PadR family transcriptional regulator